MQNTLTILAIDTSLGPCSVALLHKGTMVAEEQAPTGMQSRLLVPMIEEVLKKAQLAYRDIDLIACTIGPGGFTSIRVGLATARAIALAIEKPLAGITTLETLAYSMHVEGDVLAVIDAYRGQYYTQRFRSNGILMPQSDPLLVEQKNIASLGHGAKLAQNPIYARDVAMLAAHKWAHGERTFPSDPLYIREPDAKLPATEGLKSSGELI